MSLPVRFRLHFRRQRRQASHAFEAPEATPLATALAPPPGTPPEHSGLRLLAEGQDAYLARLALVDKARHSLDAQYFIWEHDRMGLVLLERLLAAAERGVRVRLLIDDIHNLGRDRHLALLDAHPHVEVRVFNPFGTRDWPLWRIVELLRDLRRLNHRMHNKAWIADNAAAVIGGRNIAEHYFGLHQDTNFRDLDVLVAGPAVRTLSAAFDAFWNSERARPIAALHLHRPSARRARRFQRRLARRVLAIRGFPYPIRWLPAYEARLVSALAWAPAWVVYDAPDKTGSAGRPVWEALEVLLASVQRECLLESAYLVPTEANLAAFAALSARGVRLRALTNSLASTDVPAAHAGYAKRRPGLLAAGVELYELRPDIPRRQRLFRRRHRSRSALHAKAAVLDGRWVVLGSFNLDQRSAGINTELALVVESPALAEQIKGVMDVGTAPGHAWRVDMDAEGLRWSAGEDRWRHEPLAGFWRRVLAAALAWLPIEGQL